MRTNLLRPLALLTAAACVAGLLVAPSARAEPVVGPGVGNFDLLVAEGTRLYNEKQYAAARDAFFKATRISSSVVATYLSLARAYVALEQYELGSLAYRAYVKNSPDSPDRDKAQSELEICERLLGSKPGAAKGLAQTFVSLKALLFEALDKGRLQGPGSASDLVRTLIDTGYAAPDLGEIAGKVARAAEGQADAIYQSAVKHQKVPADQLRKGAALYRLALDHGSPSGRQTARASFLEGLALLADKQPVLAEALFDEAAKGDPTDTEARFYRGLARYNAGNRAEAVRSLEAELPDDPRTFVLKVSMALETGPADGGKALEQFLFARRYKNP